MLTSTIKDTVTIALNCMIPQNQSESSTLISVMAPCACQIPFVTYMITHNKTDREDHGHVGQALTSHIHLL
jgi:hypothetical protein